VTSHCTVSLNDSNAGLAVVVGSKPETVFYDSLMFQTPIAAELSGFTATFLAVASKTINDGRLFPFISVAVSVKVSSQLPLQDLISGVAVLDDAIIDAIGVEIVVTVDVAAT